ncbi:MAG: nucleotidyltransferase domain-containing protein, partial [Candidatus Levybacteria bacterium]|nr:nucleotidyltransferase domain-containing protein [Candidatus Levybacteria bacterium]
MKHLNFNRNQLYGYFKDQPVDLVYLFGSQASKKVKPLSDIDFAIFFAENLTDQERFELKIKILGDLSEILKTDKIDLVDLKTAPPFLQFEAIRRRNEIFVRQESVRVDFETKVLFNFFDRQYFVNRHIRMGINNLKKEYA